MEIAGGMCGASSSSSSSLSSCGEEIAEIAGDRGDHERRWWEVASEIWRGRARSGEVGRGRARSRLHVHGHQAGASLLEQAQAGPWRCVVALAREVLVRDALVDDLLRRAVLCRAGNRRL